MSATLFQAERTVLGPNTLPVRPYQAEAIAAVRREFAHGKRKTLLILPTGTGKTVVFGNIARLVVERGGRVLVLAHRKELIDQAVNTMDRIGIECGVERAESYARAAFDPDVVVATVQTMQGDRLASWPHDHFRLIVVDEGHHATAASYQAVLGRFSRTPILGVTATADRADGAEMSEVFESVAFEMSLWDAMTAPDPGPYLSRLQFVQCDVDIDLKDIRTTGGDFNQADLEAAIRPLIDTLANAIRQEATGRSTLIFTPDVGSAQAMATAMQSMGLSADFVSGVCPDRAAKIERYQAGATQFLASCSLLTEGFDAPRTAAIGLCRPTKSRPLFAQMAGRGTRLFAGKENCLLIDFNYLTRKHDLVRPVDLFDTTHADEDVLGIAQEIARKNKGKDLVDAIEEAQAENEARKVLRIKAKEREVRYRRVSYDPLSVGDVLGVPRRGTKDAVIHKATPAQVAALTRFKVEGAEGMSRARASTMLDLLCRRAKAGLATFKQVAWAIKEGVEPAQARAMTFAEASAFLDSKFGQRRA